MTGRPKLEVVRPADDVVELYVNGKFVLSASYDMHGTVGMEAIQAAARHVARALGADVVPVDAPSRQPYTYFVTYVALTNGPIIGQRFGFIWCTRSKEIEGAADTEDVVAAIKADRPGLDNIVITNFICTDGPY